MTPSLLLSPPFTAYILCNQAAFIAATLMATLADENLPELKQLARPARRARTECVHKLRLQEGTDKEPVGSALWSHRIPKANTAVAACSPDICQQMLPNAEMQKRETIGSFTSDLLSIQDHRLLYFQLF